MKMKKFFSILLALVMVLSLSVAALAEEGDGKVTITVPVNGHTYNYYQIFVGDVSGNKLSNVKWGANGTGTPGSRVDDTTLQALNALVDDTTKNDAQKADIIKTYKSGTGTAIEGASARVLPGYYLIEDATVPTTESQFHSLYVIKVCNDVEINPKGSVPTVEKKVMDTNDSTGSNSEWQDSADYDIGDAVPFRLTATLPDNLDGYTTYKLVFCDTLSSGLSYNADSLTVKVDGNSKNGTFSVTDGENGMKCFTCLNVLDSSVGAHAGSTIVLEYTATLGEGAVIGSDGNPNEVYLQYSNNPYVSTETGHTPTDLVKVFTYVLIVNKVDDEAKALEGAGFTLYKKNAQGEYVAVGAEHKGTEEEPMTTFTWSGLDDGDYKLVESTTPAGFNTIDPMEFTVTAVHDAVSDDPQLTSLTANGFTPSLTDCSLSADVTNYSGTVLPTTGGIGTTLFYVFGSLLIAGAGILLITKKRMAARG